MNASLVWLFLSLLGGWGVLFCVGFFFCGGVCWVFLLLLLGSHEYPRDNQTLKLFVFNILLVGRKSGGKKK